MLFTSTFPISQTITQRHFTVVPSVHYRDCLLYLAGLVVAFIYSPYRRSSTKYLTRLYRCENGRLPASAFGIPLSYGRRANNHTDQPLLPHSLPTLSRGVEQVAGVGPAFKHWQCLVITDILYLHKLVGRERVELPESKTTDLQSAPLPFTVYLPK